MHLLFLFVTVPLHCSTCVRHTLYAQRKPGLTHGGGSVTCCTCEIPPQSSSSLRFWRRMQLCTTLSCGHQVSFSCRTCKHGGSRIFAPYKQQVFREHSYSKYVTIHNSHVAVSLVRRREGPCCLWLQVRQLTLALYVSTRRDRIRKTVRITPVALHRGYCISPQ